MKKIITIIGARPQIIKSAALSRAVNKLFFSQLKEIVVHTGQHYSESMSDVFFGELGLPQPNYNLQVGSGSHAHQTAEMMKGLETIFEKEKPDAVVVYGDTNSTLAGAMVASKMHIPLVHIEAGLRSFNKSMPEEINRILCDHVSTLLFSPTASGIENLKKEGFKMDNSAPFNADNPKVYHSGDIMYDNSLYFAEKVKEILPPYELMTLQSQPYFLGTVHRPSNTDNPVHLESIFQAFLELTERYPEHIIYLPLHPRTKRSMNLNFSNDFMQKIEEHPQLKIIPPVSFIYMIALQQHCDLIITDSGGMQKEAYFFKKPSVILRSETEWVEIVEQGVAVTVGSEKEKIIAGVEAMLKQKEARFIPLYGDGKAAEFIAQEIINHC